MIVKVIKRFRDKHDKVTFYDTNRVLELDDERAENLIERGIVEAVNANEVNKVFVPDKKEVKVATKKVEKPATADKAKETKKETGLSTEIKQEDETNKGAETTDETKGETKK